MHAANFILLAVWWDAQLVRWVVWVGLVLVTVVLLLLIRTRWGQQPLAKCVVLSLLAHLLLAIYMTTVNIVTATSDSPPGEGVHVAIVNGPAPETVDESLAPEAWNAIAPGDEMPIDAADLAPIPAAPALEPVAEPERELPADTASTDADSLPDVSPSEEAPAPELLDRDEPVVQPAAQLPDAAELPSEEPESTDLVPPPPQPTEPVDSPDGPQPDATDAAPAGDASKPSSGQQSDGADLNTGSNAPARPLPKIYQARAGNHLQGQPANGATRETEAAVNAALHWLVATQSGDGRWDPRAFNGGSAVAADGEDRQGAGAHADTGITGLALLAFLAAGHTHLDGEHRDTVRRGLEFLLVSQDATGNLGATNNLYERMYCHAMAACALSEAYAMTGDGRLLAAVRAAIQYTVRTQDRSGSWRYQVGQPGDTSQLGWQLMALKSAEIGGLAMPATTRLGIERFLTSVASGRRGGLACYQPTRPIATRSMTAEALACRQFLGRVDGPETIREATSFLLEEPPGVGQVNHYYWYYGTLALHQAQGDAWQRWNTALQRTLLAAQRVDGAWAGSWDPDPVWGRCGGRVYSTSLCALCLEVYYRYLPLVTETAARQAPAR